MNPEFRIPNAELRAVIFSTTYFPLVGGAEVAMKEITDRLPNWQFDLICARIKPGLKFKERIGNVTVHRVGFGHSIDKYLLPIFGSIYSLFAFRSSPFVIWSLMASYGGFTALVYTWLRPKSRMLLTLQEGDPLEHYAERAGYLMFLHKKIFARANAVQAISRFLSVWAKKMGFGGVPEVVPNGVNVAQFSTRISLERRAELRREFGFANDDIVLVTTSRLSLKNGVDDMIRALTHLPDNHKALIIGEGEDQDKLLSLTKQKELSDRVVFLGRREHDELPAILQASDIFIRPSLSEGLGNSFLEAMAAGLPIIGTSVGGIPDFLLDGHTGVFCEVRDPESIAKAVLRIQTEPGLREKLIEQGAALVHSKYDWDTIARQMEELLLSVTHNT
ncbi:MAG: glycosyltransferase family 4 protein [Patescibacteria group bacterium]|nr:glycosyltransferase family 4 protein [Patescibacteria group bacterium]MBU2509411.1 glycosyltransferase family 4 protein [Patescibacteria group bacterium]